MPGFNPHRDFTFMPGFNPHRDFTFARYLPASNIYPYGMYCSVVDSLEENRRNPKGISPKFSGLPGPSLSHRFYF